MNIKRALITIIVAYAIVFLIGSIFIGLSLQSIMPYAMVLLNAIVVYVAALNLYFQPVEPLNSLKEGAKLGLLWVIISFILDAGILVYGFNAGDWALMTSWNMIVGYAETLLIPILIGFMQRN
jgi:hypothetical protein